MNPAVESVQFKVSAVESAQHMMPSRPTKYPASPRISTKQHCVRTSVLEGLKEIVHRVMHVGLELL